MHMTHMRACVEHADTPAAASALYAASRRTIPGPSMNLAAMHPESGSSAKC